MIQSLLEHIIASLVDQPSLVTITQKQDGNRLHFSVKVGEQDLGRVIGKDGQTIRAIRTLALSLTPEGQETLVEVSK